MFGWVGAVGYSSLRTALAIGLAIRAPRLGGQRWAVLSQALADACYGAFPIAYVGYGLRHALGWLWVPLWLFAAAWDEPPPFVCAPAVRHPGDMLTLKMDTPHGGELGVFTPTGRFLYVVPFAGGGSRQRGTGFDWRTELRLRTAEATGSLVPGGARRPIFGDSGVYRFQISEPAGGEASLGCRVTYTGTPR